jgi:hypothetical protein
VLIQKNRKKEVGIFPTFLVTSWGTGPGICVAILAVTFIGCHVVTVNAGRLLPGHAETESSALLHSTDILDPA